MTPNEMPQPGLFPVIGEGTRGAPGLSGVHALGQPVPQVEVHEMAAQVQPGEVAVVADPALGELLVVANLMA